MAPIDKFRKLFNKVTDKKGDQWFEKIPAWTGNYSGVVSTGGTGMIYVRVDGQVAEVFNQSAPAEHNIPVLIGRHKDQPHLWQVIGRREVWSAPASPDITHHGLQHSFGHPDMTPVDRKQLMALTVMVSDAANFVVMVYGALVHTANGIKKIDTQTLDLSSYVITSGAKFVNIEVDDDGAITANEGTVFGSPTSGTAADIPVPASGKYLVATVLFYEGQATLSNNDIAVPMVLPGASGGGDFDMAAAIHAADASAITDDDEIGFWESVAGALKKITWANIVATLTAIFDALYMSNSADYSSISANDAATDVTGAELEELTDGSETTLHSHAGGGNPIWITWGIFKPKMPVDTSYDQPYAVSLDRTVTFVSWFQEVYVLGTNNGSNYWKIQINRASDGAVVAEVNTSALGINGLGLLSTTTFSIASVGTAGHGLYMYCIKVGSPTPLYVFGPSTEVTV